MYHAKKKGRNTFHFFSEDMHERALRNARLKKDLGTAIQNRELFLLYQPQIDFKEKRVNGFEALLRWRHSRFGKTSRRMSLSTLAEEKGLIHPIGQWVLNEVCGEQCPSPERSTRNARGPSVLPLMFHPSS